MGLFLCFATAVAVFWLPFLFPPPVLHGQSAANVAGFNNKVASVAAAFISFCVLVLHLREEPTKPHATAPSHLRPAIVVSGIAAMLVAFGSLCYLFAASHTRYAADAGYFIAQMSDHQVYSRTLYQQIEFPYGPLLFYGPIWLQSALSPLHVSLTVAYCLTMLTEQVIGLLLLAYTLNNLEISARSRTVFFLLCVLLSVPVNVGINYTFFRFIVPASALVLLSRLRSPLLATAWAAAAEVLCLCISPEMGLSFLLGSTGFSLYKSTYVRRAWLSPACASFCAALLFLLSNRTGYLRMLGLFAGGINNLIVEPVPFVLIFLFAFVWLVPRYIADQIRQRSPQAPPALALYLSAVALLPVGFGRTDPQHLFFNEIAVYALSLAAVAGLRPRLQGVWVFCVSVVLVWTAVITALYPQCRSEYMEAFKMLYSSGTRPRRVAIHLARSLHLNGTLGNLQAPPYTREPFDETQLERYVHGAPVNTPVAFGFNIEQYLREKGEFVPTFYNFGTAVLDESAERRQIDGFKVSDWMLLPKYYGPMQSETPENTQWMMGISLPYRTKREPYTLFQKLQLETQHSWKPVADLGSCILYHRVGSD